MDDLQNGSATTHDDHDDAQHDATSSRRDDPDDVLAQRFREFASTARRLRAPLYRTLASGIADDAEIHRLLLHADEMQRVPVLLFACTHFLLLEEPEHPLARWYPNLTDDPLPPDDRALAPMFARFVADRAAEVTELLATRTTQTNEVGRCALLLPALGMVADEVGPIGLLDVGTSGGLNLLLDRYEYRYRPHRAGDQVNGVAGRTVGAPSAVVLETTIDGNVPIPAAMPPIGARLGIDRDPIDVTDPAEARWLEACVWPDQAERFHRLRAAIELAGEMRPTIRAGDAVESLAAGIAEVGASRHPVVTNSWVLSYLAPEARVDYLAELDRVGATRDLSWIYVEAAAQIPELPTEPDPADDKLTVLTLARWRDGKRSVRTLATCHPHGHWIRWR